jgi:hypothetical protein
VWLYAVTPAGQYHRLDADTGAIHQSWNTPVPVDAFGGTGLAHAAIEWTFFSDVTSSHIYRLDGRGIAFGSFPKPATTVDALAFGATSYGPTLFALASGDNRVYLLKPYDSSAGAVFTSYPLDFDAAGGMDYDTASGAHCT